MKLRRLITFLDWERIIFILQGDFVQITETSDFIFIFSHLISLSSKIIYIWFVERIHINREILIKCILLVLIINLGVLGVPGLNFLKSILVSVLLTDDNRQVRIRSELEILGNYIIFITVFLLVYPIFNCSFALLAPVFSWSYLLHVYLGLIVLQLNFLLILRA